MHKISKKNPNGSSPLGRFFSSFKGRKTNERSLVKAPRRRDIERLEERQMLSVNFSDDPLFQDQWHLQATMQRVEQPDSPTFTQSLALLDINVLGAWELGYTGSGVQVAVVDGGVDLDHPDLKFITTITDTSGGDPNAITFFDILDLDNVPSFIDTTDAHGTAVAGIIGALDNTIGGVGVAPGVDLIPIRFILGPNDLPTGVSTEQQLAYLEFLQFAGVPLPGEDGTDSANVVDIYNRSYGPSDETRDAVPLSTDRLEALRVAATLGRGTWIDLDNDGVFEVEEIESLGSINVVAAGNGSGPGGTFRDIGVFDSSQYDGLANSRYTIAVGSVDFAGNYTNPETGTRGSWAETGSNVLIVAPSQTFGIGFNDASNTIGGLSTTDIEGEEGYNSSPVFGFEADGDYLVDTDYTSTFGGTSGAAPQVTGAIALMLEANPKLSYRDVQQILLMSAEQIDIFDETWIVNSYQYFEDTYVAPSYAYRGFDTNFDGDLDVENGILPGYLDDNFDFFVTDEEFILRELAVDSAYSQFNFVDIFTALGGNPTSITTLDSQGNELTDIPIFAYPVDFNDASAGARGGIGSVAVTNPISGQNKHISNTTTSTSNYLFGGVGDNVTSLVNNELKFDTGSGFTVSWGYGDQWEEYGYAHGSLDTELAVRLAEAWETYDLYLEDEISITNGVIGGNGSSIRIQPSADILLGNDVDFTVPGGWDLGSGANIDSTYYSEFFREYTYTNISDADGNAVGSVLTDAPWYNPDGRVSDLTSDRGQSRVDIPIDTSVLTEFMSVEWVEFTAELDSGDIDQLRISIVSPDGTQTELNPYRVATSGNIEVYQSPQGQQGAALGTDEILDQIIGIDIINDDLNTTAFIDGQEDPQLVGVGLGEAPLTAGESWTWTTNRHWGELFSTEAQNNDVPGAAVEGQWYLVFENWGSGAVQFDSQYEVSFHGVEATGNRIQGKIGVDDNAQAREDQDGDELFNFNRNITFGEVDLATLSGFVNDIQVVLDDATDSVHYANNYYETVDDSTGQVYRYAVVDQFEYTALAEIDKGAVDANFNIDPTASLLSGGRVTAYSEAEVAEWYNVYGAKLEVDYPGMFPANPVSEVDLGGLDVRQFNPESGLFDGDFILSQQDIEFWQANLEAIIAADMATAEAFEPQLNYDIASGVLELDPRTDAAGNVFDYQNFDYNQETFASNVLVQATQYVINYDSAGNPLPRTATGVVDSFVTGADGNYWFDVEANEKPPELADFATQAAYDAVYEQWFDDFGKVFEYEISISSVDPADQSTFLNRVIDKDYSSKVDFLKEDSGVSSAFVDYGDGSIDYQAGSLIYNVPIFASPDVHNGQVTVLKDVNFLLEVDPAKTNVNVTGSVYRDQDGDNIFDSSEAGAAGSVVYHDANGSGTLDVGEASGVVDASGNYAFTVSGITSQQSITLTVDASTIPANLELLNPSTGSQSINVTPGFGVDLDFTLQLLGGEPALVQGIVYEDINQNATFDNTEFGLGLSNQVTVYIDLNNDGVYDVGTEPSSTTLSDGTFAIESDIAGNYNVRVDLSSSPLTISAPINNAINVDVVVGEAISDLQFGMFDSRTQDFGDLLGYPTLLSQNGARHVVVPGVRLGSRVDIDDDGMPTADAQGDNLTNVNDEDGVVILGDISANSDFDLEITAFGEGYSLNAWIDFNNDGDWDDLGEQIFVDAGLTLGTKNTLTVTAPADVDPTATELAARFRWGPFALSYDGPAAAGEVEDYLLPTSTPVNISGIVRNDADGDGIYDLTDTPVENVVVYYDVNSDGIRQASEISSVTNAVGEYQIAISTAAPLAVTLRIDETSLLNNEEFISPIDGIFSQVVNPGVAETANFLVGFPQGVQGNVFADNDNNGLKGGTETGFAGITVNLFADSNNDGSYETFVASTVTDAAGDYTLPVAVADDYQIRLDFADLEFHSQTTPAGGQVVTIAPGVVGTAADFGIYNAALDFTADYGDLFGANFPTLESDSGASHTVDTDYFLGSGVDADPGTLTSVNATADDNSLTDDEDGIVLVSNQILANSDVEIDITATGVGGVMNAWIDFNNDGDWDDLGEQILIDRPLTSGATTRVVIDTTGIDVSATASSLAARFRWGSAGLGYGGADTLGEVEDYLLPTASINPNNVTGDYDGNGLVEMNDHAVWAASYGSTTNLDADGNDDGKVDAADYTVWRDALGAASSAAASASASSDDSSQGEMLFVSPATYVAAATSQVVMEEADVEIPQLVQHPVEEEFAIVETVEVIASASQSLTLEAAVLIDSSQDESFAVGAEEDSEVTLAEETFDAALLSLDDLAFATDSEQDSEFALVDEGEEDESLDEVLSEAFATI